MGTIAKNLISKALGEGLKQDAIDIQLKIENTKGMLSGNILELDAHLSTFNPCDLIKDRIKDFLGTTNDYVMDFEKAYRDKSKIIDDLKGILTTSPCLALLPSVARNLGLSAISDLDKLTHLPLEFIDWLNVGVFQATINNIANAFPCMEFSIGCHLGLTLGLTGNLNIPLLFQILDCIESLGIVDPTITRLVGNTMRSIPISAAASSDLASMKLDINGNIDTSKLLVINPNITNDALNNIKQITRATQVVLNNTTNNISKALKTGFSTPSFNTTIF